MPGVRKRKKKAMTRRQQALAVAWLPLAVLKAREACDAAEARGHRPDRADARGEALLALCRAATTYDESVGSFGAYAGRAAWRDADRVARRAPPPQPPAEDGRGDFMQSLPQPAGWDGAAAAAALVERLLKHVSGRELRFVRWRYLDGMNNREIGERAGLSRERVRQILDGALGRLRAAAEKIGEEGEW